MHNIPEGVERVIFTKIKELRLEHELKQIVIARVLGVAQNTYSDYELGKVSVPVDIIIKLARFYRVSTDYILGIKCPKNLH